MDALFVFVAPKAALKINVKVDWSSRHFSQNFNILINHGLSCIDVSLVPMEILQTDGDRSGGYRGNSISQSYMDVLLVPVVLHFDMPEPVSVLVRPRMTMPQYISQNQQTLPKQ